jgi:SAM-dependent methyltransferase
MTWWSALYDDLLADVLLDATSPAHIAAEVAFLVEKLQLSPGDRVFDQCAGVGRIAIPLAHWGARVVAVEQAARYVERARSAARAANVELDIVAGDAFEYVPADPCRGALNWWTSFGYLPDDDGNARMLRRAFEALAPGGRFAIDFLNVPNICRDFRPHDIDRRNDIVMLRESRLDLARGLLHKSWTFIAPDGSRIERPSTVRLYTPDRLAALLAQVGFTDLAIYGGVDAQPLTLASPRCIVVGARP